MKALVLLSGGIDSTTCLAMAIDRYGAENVAALSVSYGQKHIKELESAKKVAKYYGISISFIDLAQMFAYSDCSLLSSSSEAIPEMSYAEQQAGKSIRLNLQNDLILSGDLSIERRVKFDIKFLRDGTLDDVTVSESSGTNAVDEVVRQSIINTLIIPNS